MRTSRRMPRRLALAASALLVATGLAACSSSNGADASGSLSGTVPQLKDDQQVDIVFESYNLAQAGVWGDTVTQLIDEFETAHPNIHVTAQPTQGYSASNPNTVGSVQTQVLAGKAPDVAQLTFDALDFSVNELGAQPIEKLFGTDEVTAAFGGDHPFHPKAAALGDWDGVTYGMPYVFSTPVLWYNATALEAAGLPADVDLSTWEKVGEAAEAVTRKTGKPALTVTCSVIGGNWCMQGIMKSNGGSVLSEDRTTVEFGEPAAVGAVQELRRLYDEGVLANLDASAQMEAFQRGDSAIQLQTSAVQSTYMAAATADGWELKDTVMPSFGSKPAVPTNSGSALFMFSSDPAKQRAAWEFMQWMTSDRAYELISTGIGYLPLRTSLTEGDGALAAWAAGNPLVAPNLKQLDDLQPWVSYPGDDYVQVDQILGKAVEDSIFYGKDPATTLAVAQKRAQSLIEK